MSTELGFLMDLFLDDALPKDIRIKIAGRIKDVEGNLSIARPGNIYPAINPTPIHNIHAQAPSTIAAMARHQDPTFIAPPVMAPIELPVVQIAQTPLAAQAMNNRQDMINKAMIGKGKAKNYGNNK